MKRAFDLVVGAVLALVTAPAVALLAVAVIVTSGWPPFYRARRAGAGNRTFMMWKLRSMRPAPLQGSPITLLGDERLTRFGAWMRRHRLDELPQFWNVVCGQMSMVGPRPEDVEVARRAGFEESGILRVRPGITGLCQLEMLDETELLGPDGTLEDYERHLLPRKMALDLEYVRRQSFGLDLRILLDTIVGLIVPHANRRR